MKHINIMYIIYVYAINFCMTESHLMKSLMVCRAFHGENFYKTIKRV